VKVKAKRTLRFFSSILVSGLASDEVSVGRPEANLHIRVVHDAGGMRSSRRTRSANFVPVRWVGRKI
jgi:hypothetical protein